MLGSEPSETSDTSVINDASDTSEASETSEVSEPPEALALGEVTPESPEPPGDPPEPPEPPEPPPDPPDPPDARAMLSVENDGAAYTAVAVKPSLVRNARLSVLVVLLFFFICIPLYQGINRFPHLFAQMQTIAFKSPASFTLWPNFHWAQSL